MGFLNLDLRDAERKFARAREHMASLDAEVAAIIEHNSPYTVRLGQVDPNTGWIDVFQTTTKRDEPRLGIIYGDVLNNLRSTLDYIIAALAQASGIDIAREHQFPIRDDQRQYETGVAHPVTGANPNGPLRRITAGLADVERFQPYHRQPYPRTHPLFIMNWQSNADKHRRLSTVALVALSTDFRFRCEGCRFVEERAIPPGVIRFDEEVLVQRVRVALPLKPEAVLHYKAEVHAAPQFDGPPSGRGPGSVPLPPENEIIHYIEGMLNHFMSL